MMRMNVMAAALVATSAACASTGAQPEVMTPHSSFAGTWVLNVAESSDSSRASMRALDAGTRPAPAAGADQIQEGMYGDTTRYRRINDETAARVLAVLRTPIERLTVSDSAGMMQFRVETQSVVIVPGSSTRKTWLDGTSALTRVRWVDQRLEIERRLERGITVQEYYSRSPGASKLVVFTIVRGGFDGEMTVRRVYDLFGA
jgi:hypothetical protein